MMRALILLISVLVLSACQNKPAPRRTQEKAGTTSPVSLNTCQGNQLSFRVLSTTGSNFRSVVGDLVSASMNPSSLGQISGEANGTTGVEIQIKLEMDSTKSIISEKSQFKLIIRDSLVGQPGSDGKPIDPIQIVHTTSSELGGDWDASAQKLNLTFSDAYGEINLSGQIQGDQLMGQVLFKNTQSWDGSTARQGTLGQFKTTATGCAF